MTVVTRAENYWVNHARRQIFDTYGDIVDAKPTKLLQPGINPDMALDTEETTWLQGGTETFVSANSIDRISSSWRS